MNMNQESKRQELGRRLVDREVYYCVSSLVGTLSALAQNCDPSVLRNECLDWEEDILPLLESTNYEEAVRQYVMNDADLSDLEGLVENDGYWSDFLKESVGYDMDNPPQTEPDDDGDTEDIDLDDWLEQQAIRSHLCEEVFEFLSKNSDFEELCREFNIDTDDFRDDVYEHYIISGWLAARLRERGEVTGDLCGMTIWGRCCTGQAICLDHVIQEIACELWPEDLKEDAS